MKKFILILSLLCAMSISAISQNSFNIQSGYSYLSGIIGVEYQKGHFGIAAGYVPAKLPISGDYVSSFSSSISYYLKKWDKSTPYLSLGMASAGYRVNDEVLPITILMAGYKYNMDMWYFKGSLGTGWNQNSLGVQGEIMVGYHINW